MGFLILPDTEEAAGLAQRAGGGPPAHPQRVVHPASGRPWLLGDWAEGELTLVTAGTRRLALIGSTRIDGRAAERELARVGSPRALDPLIASLPGCFHLSVSFDGTVRSQGSISTARQIFYGHLAGAVPAADAPDTLRELTGAGLDEEALALRLLAPAVPWPLHLRTLWTGIQQLAPGHWLCSGPGPSGHTVRWWRPPAVATSPLPAVDRVRESLCESVSVRVAGRGTIGADLSGGLDSTSLCFLAAAEGADLLTHHWRARDAANDDYEWARRAAALLPTARHRCVEPAEALPWFASGTPGADGLDAEGPASWTRNRAHTQQLAQADRDAGATLHLMGLGGDELFAVLPSYLWTFVREHPLRAVPVIRRYQAVNRWRSLPLLRALADRGDLARWLRNAAATLTAPLAPPGTPDLEWNGPVRMPPWATPEAVAMVRRALCEAAALRPEPLGADRIQHATVCQVVQAGSVARHMARTFASFGVAWSAPFLDDRVLEAALSVRLADRSVPGQYKPVLTAAMRGTVPAPLLERRSKGHYTAEMYDGLLRNRRTLLDQCAELRLADRGLVDSRSLHEALLRLGPEPRHLIPFENTLACERWLRTLPAPLSRPAEPAGDPV